MGGHETGWELPASCCRTLSRGGGLWGLNLRGPSWLVAGGAPGRHQHLGGASRSSASRINGYLSSLDAWGPHQSGKLAGLGLACPTLPAALRGEGIARASQLVSGPRVLPPRDDRKWVPMVGCGSWQQRGEGGMIEGRQQSAKGAGWEAVMPLPLQYLRLPMFFLWASVLPSAT